MNMTLAAVLGLCVLAPSLAAVAPPAQRLQLSQETQPAPDTAPSSSPQDSPPNSAPAEAPPSAEPKAEPAKPSTPVPAQVQEPQTTESKTQTESKTPAPKTKAPSKKRRHKKPATPPSETPEKKVVRDGGTTDPVVQLAPGMSEEQASSQRQSTSQLLGATDANLKQISSRQLNASQQDSVSQIRKYMEQAKAAENTGDVQRAHNLASKALMLSDDLAKH